MKRRKPGSGGKTPRIPQPLPSPVNRQLDGHALETEAMQAEMEIAVQELEREIHERRKSEQALRESERKYRSVIENIQDMFFRCNKDRRLVMASPSAAELFGFDSVEEMIGLQMDAFMPDPEDRRKLIAEMRASGRVKDFEAVMVRRDGSWFCASCTIHFCYDENGQPSGTEGIIRDVTERVRAQEERLELERRLLHGQKLESLGVLAGGIAHDFNNLLMAVLGNLDIALMSLPADSPARAGIDQAIAATRRATDLTREMLAYSGKGSFIQEQIRLDALVKENAELFRTAISHTIALALSLGKDAPVIEADPGQVQQVVMNLLTNASESIGEAQGVITLSTGVEECSAARLAASRLVDKPAPGRFAFLEVRDTGCGMTAETQQRFFDPFYTTKFTGRGLGMSAVLGIVKGHKGAIFVESAPGKGTSIRVLFPVLACCGREKAPAEPSRDHSAPSFSTSRLALVVDDEEPVRRLCIDFVGRIGFRGIGAANGGEALKLYGERAHEIAFVLLDLTMPNMDGLATFRSLKSLRPEVKVILMSGYSEQDATRRFTGEGLSGFIQKPYRLAELRDKISRITADSDLRLDAGKPTGSAEHERNVQ